MYLRFVYLSSLISGCGQSLHGMVLVGYLAFFYFPSVLQKQYDVVSSITATTIPAEPPSLPGEVHIYTGKQITNPPNFHLISRKWFHSLSQHTDHACSYKLNTMLQAKSSWYLDDVCCLCVPSLVCCAETRCKSLWVSAALDILWAA